jgi:hypothetical protein
MGQTRMNPLTKYLGIAVAVLLLALCGSLYGLKVMSESRAAMVVSLHAAKQAQSEAEAKTSRIQVQVQREKARADANRSLLRNALKQNEEWARAPVPPAVADSLCRDGAVCSSAAGTVPRAPD